MAKDFKIEDPFASREAEKYTRPIPSLELILEVMKQQGVPQKLDEVAVALGVDHEDVIE